MTGTLIYDDPKLLDLLKKNRLVESSNSVIPESNPTNSIAWLALPKETQKNLIELSSKCKSKNSVAAQMQNDFHFANSIHNIFGASRGYSNFIDDLDYLCSCGGDAKGGIWDTMREYVKKFRTIESAANSIALERMGKSEQKEEAIDRR